MCVRSIRAPAVLDDIQRRQHATDDDTFPQVLGDENRKLIDHLLDRNWEYSYCRLQSHPHEASVPGPESRPALHIACSNCAPYWIVQALLIANPSASRMLCTSGMSPLHIACSSRYASAQVTELLLLKSPKDVSSMRDIDGDTPLHTACRFGAPTKVLELLIQANPSMVLERCNEGFTVLHRLWVKYYIILGDDRINSITGPKDLVGVPSDAWIKTELLLKEIYKQMKPGFAYKALHAATSVDCPRVVLKIALALNEDQLMDSDTQGNTPLLSTAETPIYKEHDLSADGFSFDDFLLQKRNSDFQCCCCDDENDSSTPSVIELVINPAPKSAQIPNRRGRLPLHLALVHGKSWKQGVREIFSAYPEALNIRDPELRLYPFMLAAVAEDNSLTTVFQLLRHNPGVLCDGLTTKGLKECNEENLEQIDSTYKKRRLK